MKYVRPTLYGVLQHNVSLWIGNMDLSLPTHDNIYEPPFLFWTVWINSGTFSLRNVQASSPQRFYQVKVFGWKNKPNHILFTKSCRSNVSDCSTVWTSPIVSYLKKMSERFESCIFSRPHLARLRKHLPSGDQQKQIQFPEFILFWIRNYGKLQKPVDLLRNIPFQVFQNLRSQFGGAPVRRTLKLSYWIRTCY
jgi:hypothetical protein